MICVIYSPIERSLVEDIVSKLPQKWEYRFAPVGLEAGSEAWKESVKGDLDTCDLAIALLSPTALRDETVTWRCEYVLQNRIMFLPIIGLKDAGEKISLEDLVQDGLTKYAARHQSFQLGIVEDAPTEIDERQLATLAHAIEAFMVKRVVCFISYSRQDLDFAARLAGDLRKANARTWRDSENIPAGANWDRAIEKAINECTHLLLVATRQSVVSDNVMDEVSLALNKGKMVAPLMLETCDLPLRIHRAQWIDFRQGYEDGLAALLKHLGLKTGDER